MTADVLVLCQPRERTVPCQHCRRQATLNVTAVCDSCTTRAAARKANVLIDEAILEAAASLDGDWTPDDFHNAVLVRVCTAITGLDRILAAGLYRVACGEGDALQLLVRRIADAHMALVDETPAEHDGIPCAARVGDTCFACRTVNQQAEDRLIAEARVLLGDSALRDLAQVAA